MQFTLLYSPSLQSVLPHSLLPRSLLPTELVLGTGDMTPTTQGQKIFTTFYVLVGFCLLGNCSISQSNTNY